MSLFSVELPETSVSVCYVLRGADDGWLKSAERFLKSYQTYDAGVTHTPYIVLKGFADQVSLLSAAQMFTKEGFKEVHVHDEGLDIGAYINWANLCSGEYIFALNSHSCILAKDWLRMMLLNAITCDYTMVAATGSFESLRNLSSSFPKFPNPHLRSNAFLIRRNVFLDYTQNISIKIKHDAYMFESGKNSLTQYLRDTNKKFAMVGKNGRAYTPRSWAHSDTFRQGTQENLLIADNVTRTYDSATWEEKEHLAELTWGEVRQPMNKKFRNYGD